MKATQLLALIIAAMITVSIVSAEGPAGGQSTKGEQVQGSPMSSLLPKPLVEKLNLTGKQSLQLDKAWVDLQSANPQWQADLKKAYETKNNVALQKLQVIHKAAVEQWATCLTDQQKTILDEASKHPQGQDGFIGWQGVQQAPAPQQ